MHLWLYDDVVCPLCISCIFMTIPCDSEIYTKNHKLFWIWGYHFILIFPCLVKKLYTNPGRNYRELYWYDSLSPRKCVCCYRDDFVIRVLWRVAVVISLAFHGMRWHFYGISYDIQKSKVIYHGCELYVRLYIIL